MSLKYYENVRFSVNISKKFFILLHIIEILQTE